MTEGDDETSLSDIFSGENFTFSFERATKTHAELHEQVNILSDRLDKITSNVTVKGIPIIASILNLTDDPEDLERIAAALQRCAVILPHYNHLSKKHDLAKMALSEPGWTVSAFADLNTEVDTLTARFGCPDDEIPNKDKN